jgi:hypothetical protein
MMHWIGLPIALMIGLLGSLLDDGRDPDLETVEAHPCQS